MPIPIKYPDHEVDIRLLAGTMHDLNKTLRNPNPRNDWKPGDVAWVYVAKDKHLVAGPITYVTGRPDNPFCFVKDLNPDGVTPDGVGADADELFESEADLMRAMLRKTRVATGFTDTESGTHKKTAFFDLDGTIIAPTFHGPRGLAPGMEPDAWVAHCDRNPDRAFADCPVIHHTIAFAAKLAAHGWDLQVLSCTTPESEKTAKTLWLEDHRLRDMFSDIVYVTSDADKMTHIEKYAAQEGVALSDCLLVEDSYTNVLSAIDLGIRAVHVANIITGFADTMAGLP